MNQREKAFLINHLGPLFDVICEDWRRIECRGTLGIPDTLLIIDKIPLFVEVKYQDRPNTIIDNLKGSQVTFLNSVPFHSFLLIGFASVNKMMLFRGGSVSFKMKSVGGELLGIEVEPLRMRLTPPTY